MGSIEQNADGQCWRGVLLKDGKLICDIQSYKVSISLPSKLVIESFDSESIFPLSRLPSLQFSPLGPNPARLSEWQRFLGFLAANHKVAIVRCAGWELLINPPVGELVHPKQPVSVSYRQRGHVQPLYLTCPPVHCSQDTCNAFRELSNASTYSRDLTVSVKKEKPSEGQTKFAQTHPSYLETLGQNHASWIFGALAELIDNARDAGATRLDIMVQEEYFRALKSKIPVLSVTDNGTGMTHSDILRMVSFGHKKPESDDEGLIGRFGVGFKTGAMRLGKDAIVFTQSKQTRSIAFLSRSFNEGKEELEIPIITYQKDEMVFDLQCHSEEEAEARLKVIGEYSPFNMYNMCLKFAAFGDEGTGTTVCIYNLDQWGSDYSLQWDSKVKGEGGHKSRPDITIRSRRVRSRPAQMTREVPLDYSLHAYLEVMFLEPKMKIYVQGTLVKARRLHKSLNKTRVYKDALLGRSVELTLGRSQAERDRGNCGIFLYWHGRLIEAYKRVGGMVHTADMGRGVIGVIDVTDIMRLENGVAVLNNKQGFLDCEAYAVLEDWLGNITNKYWDGNFDPLKVEGQKEENAVYTPDHEWVQCNKCLRWRILDQRFDSNDFGDEWFCYMPPFKGSCSMPQEEAEDGIVTIGAVRRYGSVSVSGAVINAKEEELSATAGTSCVSNKEASDGSLESDDKATTRRPTLRRLKRGPNVQSSKGRQCTPKKVRKG